MPGVIGCIDGSYIKIRTPAKKIRSTYVNRHHQPSLTLQGICDNKKKFLNVFTGVSGKIHDSRVFSLSFISDDLPNICGNDYHLLGDAAYPLTPYLITPYRDYGNLTAAQINFNYRFSRTRVLIENSFGLLKGRFRQLTYQTDFLSVIKTSKFILSCCVLHNLCIDNGDNWGDIYEDDIDINNDEMPPPPDKGLLRQLGEEKRNYLRDIVNTL